MLFRAILLRYRRARNQDREEQLRLKKALDTTLEGFFNAQKKITDIQEEQVRLLHKFLDAFEQTTYTTLQQAADKLANPVSCVVSN